MERGGGTGVSEWGGDDGDIGAKPAGDDENEEEVNVET